MENNLDMGSSGQENPNATKAIPSNMDKGIDGIMEFVESWFGMDRPKTKQGASPSKNSSPQKTSLNRTASTTSDSSSPIGKQMVAVTETGVEPTPSAAGVGLHPFDLDGDGDVDMEDLYLAMQASVEDEACDTVEHLTTYRPWFILFQVLACAGLWIGGSIVQSIEEGGGIEIFVVSLGGLETIFPGKTMVVVYEDCTDLRGEVWRLITYQWTHGNFTHMAMNSLLTLIVGIPLEGFHGHIRVFLIFNVSVVGGALCHMISRTHGAGLVGMSAGCYSLMAIHMADLVMNWRQNRYRRPKLFALLVLIVIDIASAQFSKPDDPTGHSAHLGGYLAGLIFGVLFVRNVKVKMWERVLQGVMIFIGLGLFAFAIGWIAQWPPRSIWDAVPYCFVRQIYTPGWQRWECVRCGDDACIEEIASGFLVELADYKACEAVGWYTAPLPG